MCDHSATRATLPAFRRATVFIGFQEVPDGETLMLGNCRGCSSTLAVPIEIPRGNVVAGEIGAMPTGRTWEDPPF